MVPAAFLDIQSVYDNVLPDVLIDRLGIPPLTRRFIYNDTSFRRVTCRFGELDEKRYTYKGLPQGSVLSSLLYTLYVAQFDKICTKGSKIIQYADNVCIFSTLPMINEDIQSLERTVEKITRLLLSQLGLSILSSKTQFYVFKGPRRKNIAYTLMFRELLSSSPPKLNLFGFEFSIKSVLGFSCPELRKKMLEFYKNVELFGSNLVGI